MATPEEMAELSKRISQHRQAWKSTNVITVTPESLAAGSLRPKV
jgi:hypothetical protein